ncbi:hypothetical protein BAE44_0019402 [Dichanthelium oligosanthes]|uniref:Uncharacterized protein n=1 Tax=Dichanthelium oligosanthes TaxID=888268 RepID=A0A1E5V3C8_9POAL|nr:hypothetical protein BAE44_0019402 [Dichanthelium oligosanthes]
MDELNRWPSHPDPEDELPYMYRQQEEHAGMQQHFAERVPEQQQYYAPLPPMAPPPTPNPISPSHPLHQGSSFPGFGVPALPSLLLGDMSAKSEPGQPSSSSSIFSFGRQPPSTLNFSGGDWPNGIEAAQQVPERRSRAHWNTQEHVIAERKRRERMQQQFVALATIVPDLTKPTAGRGHAGSRTTTGVCDFLWRRGAAGLELGRERVTARYGRQRNHLRNPRSKSNPIGEGFSTTVELVANLTMALRGFST